MESPIQITTRRFDASPALRDHVARRLGKLERFYDGIIDARVVLSSDGSAPDDKEAEISVGVYQKRLSSSSAASTYEEAVNNCAESLRRQLERYKSRLRGVDQDRY